MEGRSHWRRKKIDAILIDAAFNTWRSFAFLDNQFNKFRDKMNEHLKKRIPLTNQHLNFQQMKDENGPNLKSVLDEIDSKFISFVC